MNTAAACANAAAMRATRSAEPGGASRRRSGAATSPLTPGGRSGEKQAGFPAIIPTDGVR